VVRSAGGALGRCDRIGGSCQTSVDGRRVERQVGCVKENSGERIRLFDEIEVDPASGLPYT
jgi:hypothetical protein